MSRSTPILALGLGFILGGIAFFVWARRLGQAAAKSAPKRKSDERAYVTDQKNNAKLSLAGGIVAGFGAVLVAVSFI